LLIVIQGSYALQNPLNNFCRRYGHQTTVIDDKLYIDGGWVNYDTFAQDHTDYENTWLSCHDLNNLTKNTPEAWPQLNISLNKDPNVVPTVQGGALWGDNVKKRFYLFGGALLKGLPQQFHLFSYDIPSDKWNDLGPPSATVQPNITSYSAGVGISETGEGYYYGGWVSNTSMQGWTQPPAMTSNLYRYEYDTNKFTGASAPDKFPRAEGALLWIPAGDTGLLVYIGGILDPYGNGTQAPQPMNKILIYDPSEDNWFTQTAVGVIPQTRRRFCADVAWAPDQSSYNIYLWGGLNAPPPEVNVTAFNDVYILSLPSFTWVKVFPDTSGNATYDFGHYSASCNIVKSMSQMLVIGGTYPNSDMCDGAYEYWGQHNLWTGTINNDGNNQTYWALFNDNVTTNVVPVDVYGVVGGNKNGGATQVTPKGGYDPGNGLLQTLFQRKASITRTPTSTIATSTSSSTSSSTTTPPPIPPSPGLSTGAIIGISIGGAAALIFIAVVWFIVSKRVRQRRQERRQVQMSQ
ncbi:hypothetical protein BDZ45DRAFT_545669, partial [Acephala macrosclerotiorum]